MSSARAVRGSRVRARATEVATRTAEGAKCTSARLLLGYQLSNSCLGPRRDAGRAQHQANLIARNNYIIAKRLYYMYSVIRSKYKVGHKVAKLPTLGTYYIFREQTRARLL